jgi:hypothetical protein
MGSVYIVNDGSESLPMMRTRCRNEEKELQLLLEKNLDILPGDQINPDDPRRWLLVKREMPVPDPNTGAPRWSIDFFLVDQDGIPTFVECKRFADTRSRREVVGQVLEYAANGHYYWTSDIMRTYAEHTCEQRNLTLDKALEALRPDEEESADQFFERVQQNLREGQVRLVFFLEDSPFELRSVVDFLNKQMERSEVLLVEARQYSSDNLRIVVPTLFGYTEQARLVKKIISIKDPSPRRKWDKITFLDDAKSRLNNEEVKALEELFDQCVSSGFEIGWGTGAITGSFSVYERPICPRSFLTVWTNGSLQINFGWLNGTDTAEGARDRLKELVGERVGMHVPDISKFPSYPVTQWKGKVEEFVGALNETVSEFRESRECTA